MTTLHRRPVPAVTTLAALAVVLALGVGACGTASSPTPSASPAVTPGPSAPASAPVESEEPGPSQEPSDSEGPSVPELDLDAAAAALEGIDSYRMTMEIEGASAASVEAVIIRGDQPAAHYTTRSGAVTSEIIVIGDQAWTGSGGVFQEVPASVVGGMMSAFDPAIMVQQLNQPGMAQALERIGEEDRNGVQTTHYHLDADSPGAGALASIPPDGQMDIWIAEAGYLVAMEATGMDAAVTAVRINVTDINSPANVVEPPS